MRLARHDISQIEATAPLFAGARPVNGRPDFFEWLLKNSEEIGERSEEREWALAGSLRSTRSFLTCNPPRTSPGAARTAGASEVGYGSGLAIRLLFSTRARIPARAVAVLSEPLTPRLD
jgi:hypothetical protein